MSDLDHLNQSLNSNIEEVAMDSYSEEQHPMDEPVVMDSYYDEEQHPTDEPIAVNTHGCKLKKRGRKPSKVDLKGRLEKSRQSARECRARKKLRYQYCEELVADRERAIVALRDELETYKKFCQKIDQGIIPNEIKKLVEQYKAKSQQQASTSKCPL